MTFAAATAPREPVASARRRWHWGARERLEFSRHGSGSASQWLHRARPRRHGGARRRQLSPHPRRALDRHHARRRASAPPGVCIVRRGRRHGVPPYGRSRGAPIAGASIQDLEFYINGSRRSLDDPSKARWHEKERVLLAAMEAELARQKGGASSGKAPAGDDYYDDAPPHTDDDLPF